MSAHSPAPDPCEPRCDICRDEIAPGCSVERRGMTMCPLCARPAVRRTAEARIAFFFAWTGGEPGKTQRVFNWRYPL